MEQSGKLNRICLGCMEMLPQPGMVCPHCGFNIASYQPQPQEMPAGTILAGKYLVGRALGQGGFGITYIGWDLNLAIKIAIKEYFPEGCVSRDQSTHTTIHMFSGDRADAFTSGRERFVSEARTVAKFSNLPNIVDVRDFFKENGTAYIVMEFVDGMTLQQYAKKRGGRLSAQDILPRMAPLIESLSKLHDGGMLHRDISPDNIMLQPDGTLKLLDFGAARQMSLTGERNNTINVKHGFAPEEQYRSHGEQGPWTDVYALCATIYKLLTGVTPTQSMDRLVGNDTLVPPSQLGADVSPQQEAAILHGMAVLARARTQDMRALSMELYGNSMQAPVSSPQNLQQDRSAAVQTGQSNVQRPQLLSELIARWPGNVGDAGIAAMMLPVAQQLQTLHDSGRLCLMLSPDLLRVTEQGCSIDWQRSARTTTGFFAPEQLNGGNVGPQTDVYSFCAILQLLRSRDGRAAQQGSMMDWLVARGLDVNPAARFTSMNELMGYLQRIAADPSAHTRQQQANGNQTQGKKSKLGVIVAVAAVAVLGIAAALFPYKRLAYTKAIEQAITDCDSAPFATEGVYQQLGDLMKDAKSSGDQVNFTINVEIPDYSALDFNTLEYEVPAIDWSNPSVEAYTSSLREALAAGAERSGTLYTVPDTVIVTLTKVNGKWDGEISDKSISAIDTRLNTMIDEQMAKMDTLPVELELVAVAENKAQILSGLIDVVSYIDSVTITNVEKTGDDTYRMDLSYPDPEAVYGAIAAEFESGYSGRIFDTFTPTLELSEFANLPGTFDVKAGSIIVQRSGDSYTISNGLTMASDLESGKLSAEQASSDRIFAAWGVPEVARPSTSQIIAGSASGSSSLEFRMTSSIPDTFFRVYSIDSSVKEEGNFVVSYFAKSGSNYAISIAPGNYKVLLAWGDTWYGGDYMFGPDGNYYYFDFIVDVSGEGVYYETTHIWTYYNDINKMDYDVDLTV